MIRGRKEEFKLSTLNYFWIDSFFGGNQDCFKDPMMKVGGCAAAAACDTCIELQLHNGMKGLCTEEPEGMTMETYRIFADQMKPYLRPRAGGISRLSIYREGFGQYLQDRGIDSLQMKELPGTADLKEAEAAVKSQIDAGFPVPFLLLKHKSDYMKEYVWHWFMLVGYAQTEESFFVKTATFGEAHWLSLTELWNTGYEERGGMILYEEERNSTNTQNYFEKSEDMLYNKK